MSKCKLRYFPLSSRNPQLRNLYSKSFSRKEAGQESEILADILSLTSPWGPWVPSPKVPRPDAILSQEIHFNGTAASPGQPLFPRSPRRSPCLLKSCSGFPPALRSPNVSPRASVPRPPFCPIRPGRFPEDGQRHSSRLYKGPEPWSCCEWSASSKVHKSLSSALVPDDNETNSSGEAVPSPSCHRSPAAWPSWEASAAPRFINRTQTLTFLAKMSVTTKWHGKNILKKQLMPSTTEVFISFLFQRFWQILMGIYLQGQSTDSETLSVTCTRNKWNVSGKHLRATTKTAKWAATGKLPSRWMNQSLGEFSVWFINIRAPFTTQASLPLTLKELGTEINCPVFNYSWPLGPPCCKYPVSRGTLTTSDPSLAIRKELWCLRSLWL